MEPIEIIILLFFSRIKKYTNREIKFPDEIKPFCLNINDSE